MTDKRWIVRESQTMYETPWLRLREDRCAFPDGTPLPAPWYVLEKDDYVLIVAVTRSVLGTAMHEAVLVRQYKHAAGTVVTEFPAGFIDPGEDPAHAVRRELREETGFLADQVIPLGVLYASPSVLSNRCHVYWCPDLVDRVPPSPEPSERIEVVLVPWDDLLHEVAHGRGLSDVSSVAALFLAHQRMRQT